ncbi:hypothetical protein NC651_002660 [Populus alba x Populus x berolinensis]|nr:hypothetical protein NC651_002660 [Populus alba x Populus x berolinensis]
MWSANVTHLRLSPSIICMNDPVASNLKNKSALFPLLKSQRELPSTRIQKLEYVSVHEVTGKLNCSSASNDRTTPSLQQASLKLLNNVKEAREGRLVIRLRII